MNSPKLGEIRKGSEIDRAFTQNSHKFIWSSCNDCGKTRWVSVIVRTKQPRSQFCYKCAMKRIMPWKGGRTMTQKGYIRVRCPEKFSSMSVCDGYVLEHRLVLAESLGRPLRVNEIVHHINGDKKDNRLENLKLVESAKEHINAVLEENRQLRQRVKELEAKLQEEMM